MRRALPFIPALVAVTHTLAPVTPAPLSSGMFWFYVMLIVVGAAVAAFFAGCETGLYSVNRVRLRVRAARTSPPDHAALRLAQQVDRLDDVLPALLIGFILFGAINSFGVTALLSAYGFEELGMILVSVLLVTPVLFVLVDTLPKELFRADADRVMYAAAPFIRVWWLMLRYTGILPAIQFLSRLLSKLLTRRSDADAELQHTRAHIHALLKEGGQHGVMSESQLTLLDRAFGLRESEVGDEMIPWSRCRVLQADWPREKALAFTQQHPFSRFPVMDGPRLLGIVHHIDLCLAPDRELREITQPPTRLAAGLPVRDALRSLATTDARMGIVVEGGRPVGLVTVKDLVEPLTGELQAY